MNTERFDKVITLANIVIPRMNSLDDYLVVVIENISTIPQTTDEISISLGEIGLKCPDEIFRALNILRRKGIIKGEPSSESGKWYWWK
jgi:hypothetical protein